MCCSCLQWREDAPNSNSYKSQMQLEQRVSSLQTELSNSHMQLKQLRVDMAARDQKMRHRDIELSELSDKVSLTAPLNK